ncbi:beta-1-3-galactosyl-O-glycosyl-glyco beta-1-6-N-acetylglucosaminyltransferase 3-like, partial [Brachionus plicatilis]
MKFIQKIVLSILFLLCFIIILKYSDSTQNDGSMEHKNGSTFQRDRYPIDCQLVMQNDSVEIDRSIRYLNSFNLSKHLIPDSNFLLPKSKCTEFRDQRGYARFDQFIHQIEYQFPLAFSILTYENVEQFERLLHSIYRPHNIYCVHVDLKSSFSFKQSIQAIVGCFDNVFISTKLEFVIYAGFSRLQADLNCIQDLLHLHTLISDNHPNLKNKKLVKWKYLLNMASTEFPLKTNLEFVQILKMLNGSNSIYINKVHKQIGNRMKKVFFNDFINEKIYPISRAYNNSPPHSIRIVKGSAYGIFERNFLANIFSNKKVLDFVEWLKSTYSPDEFFWASLELNVHLYENSSFKDSPMNYIHDVARFNGWYGSYDCGGI